MPPQVSMMCVHCGAERPHVEDKRTTVRVTTMLAHDRPAIAVRCMYCGEGWVVIGYEDFDSLRRGLLRRDTMRFFRPPSSLQK